MNKAFTHLILKHLFVIFAAMTSATIAVAAPTQKANTKTSPSQAYRCEEIQTEGEWLFHVVDAQRKHFGKEDLNGYFVDKEECQKSIQNIRNEQICLYAGGWQSYSLVKNYFGGPKLKTAQECFARIQQFASPNLCEMHNSLAHPVEQKTLTFDSLTACEQAMESSVDGKVCRKNQMSGYSILQIKTQKWIEPSFSYPTIEACAKKVAFPMINFKVDRSKLQETFLAGANTEIGFTLKQCRDPQRQGHIVKNQNGVLDEACLPDTFYSWGDYKKLQWYSENLNNTQWTTKFNRPLFTTQSPMATFGYGPIAMRIKIKRDVKAKLIFLKEGTGDICKLLDASNPDNTLLVIQWNNGSASGLDYIICSGAVIESWSYGTKTHYDEIVRDVTWMKNHPPSEYQTYIRNPYDVGVVFNRTIDGKNFSEQTLNNSLAYHRTLVENKLGQIFYAPGEIKNHKQHFHTRMPIYYNW